MKKTVAIVVLLAASVGYLFCQATPSGTVGAADAARIGVDSAQQLLKEVSVSTFEDSTFWYLGVQRDECFGTLRRFVGTPEAKEPIADEQDLDIEAEDQHVLGARVDFIKRANSYLAVYPVRPIPIEGITKTVSVWIVGRNFNHTLRMLITDIYGKKHEVTVGKLNFMGWKKLTVAIPPSIVQRDMHFQRRLGISFAGFRIDFDLKDTIGTYYVYFDDLRAVTDLFTEVSRDADDMNDNW